ncbi:MAG TPA: cell division protein ZapA [Hyphomicrobiaceae bacterium]|jgi:cell division protein ZapA
MGQVSVTLNGRTYRLRCEDGEEPRLFSLADHVKSKIEGLVAQFGQIGDDRLMLMAALLVTDELFEAREQLGLMRSARTARAGVA